MRSLAWLVLFLATFWLWVRPALAAGAADQIDLSAAEWRAGCQKASPLPQRMKRHSRAAQRRITVHYTDSPKNYRLETAQKLCNLFDYSTRKTGGVKRKLWGDVPYHYYIAANGELAEGRDRAFQVDSNTAYPLDGHIGVVIEGNLRDGLAPAQKRKLFALLGALQKELSVSADRIGTHQDHAETDCPGPAIRGAVEEFKTQLLRKPAPSQPRRCFGWGCRRWHNNDDEDY